jgi:hypothetical protein
MGDCHQRALREKATELPQAAVQAESEALPARMGGRPIVPNIKV